MDPEREDYADPDVRPRPVSPIVVVVAALLMAAGCCGLPLLVLYLTWD